MYSTSRCFQYGPVFSFTMVGKTFTYLLGSEAAALMFNSKNEDLNAEDVYSRLTTPVFGKGVAYDVPNHVRHRAQGLQSAKRDGGSEGGRKGEIK